VGLPITLYIGYSCLSVTRDTLIKQILTANISHSNLIHYVIIIYIRDLPNWEDKYNEILDKIHFCKQGTDTQLSKKDKDKKVLDYKQELLINSKKLN
jgi:hypothetical protein